LSVCVECMRWVCVFWVCVCVCWVCVCLCKSVWECLRVWECVRVCECVSMFDFLNFFTKKRMQWHLCNIRAAIYSIGFSILALKWIESGNKVFIVLRLNKNAHTCFPNPLKGQLKGLSQVGQRFYVMSWQTIMHRTLWVGQASVGC